MNASPNEIKNVKAEVVITSENDETLNNILLKGDRDIMYFPKSCLELITD